MKKIFSSLWFWLAVCLAIVALACFGVVQFLRSEGVAKFRRNVGKEWAEAQERRRMKEAMPTVPPTMTDEQITLLVRAYLLETRNDLRVKQEAMLMTQRKRHHAAVLAALADPAMREKLTSPDSHKLKPPPFQRACDLLGELSPPEAVAVLAPYLDDPAAMVRMHAARTIGRSGGDAMVPPLLKALRDENSAVRNYALWGLSAPLTQATLSAEARRQLFPAVRALVEEEKNLSSATEMLMKLDKEAGRAFYTSPEMLRAESPLLIHALQHLAEEKAPVAREQLLALAGDLEKSSLKYPKDQSLGMVLQMLGQQRNPADTEFLNSRLLHGHEFVAQGAAAGLLSLHGLENYEDRLLASVDPENIASAPRPAQLCLAVMECEAMLEGDGLEGVFGFLSVETIQAAAAGYEAMGAKAHQTMLADALAMFGPQGPDANVDKRRAQIARLQAEHKQRVKGNAELEDTGVFDALEDRAIESEENLELLIPRYVLANKEVFLALKTEKETKKERKP